MDINDIEGARPQPVSFIRKKQQVMSDIKNNSHTLPNSGRLTPLKLDRSYDSRRYMRVDDIEEKRRGKIAVPVELPPGLKGVSLLSFLSCIIIVNSVI